MRRHLRFPLSVLPLLLALVLPPILIAEAAHDGPAFTSRKVSSGDTRQRPSGGGEPDAATRVRRNYGQLPLSFEPNRGQADARVQYLARNGSYSLYLTADEIALALRGASAVLRIKLLGARSRARADGLDELEGRSNYLVGRDPSRWRTDVPNYGRVKYEGVYPGVDVVYYGTNRQLEYDFNVAPGADAGLIRLRVEGARGVRIEDGGDLVLPTAAGEVRQHAPRAYQEVGGVRQEVPCRYVLRGAGGVGFELGAYDRTRPLVIDPVLSYSTYLGGSGYDDGTSVAVDAQGNAYVTGHASSFNFPTTPGAAQPGNASNQVTFAAYDAFVTKLNAAGTALVYSTYLGGGDNDQGRSIAVDAAGQAYVAGHTQSANFPVTTGAYRRSRVGWQDVFVSKLSASGSALLYSTYLGGTGFEENPRLALSASGDVYVGGRTSSADFPVTPNAFQTQAQVSTYGSTVEGFVARLSPTPGAGLIFSTYLGGSGDDLVEGIAVAPGSDDSVYVTGRTFSFNFPTTPGAFQTAYAGDGWTADAFVTKLNAAGTALVYSTYLGGSGDEHGGAVAVDAAGATYVAGLTSSPSFPTTPGAFQTTYAGSATGDNNYDAFVTKLDAAGAAVVYSTFLGGNGGETANAVAVDAQGRACVAGETGSTDFPVSPNGWQTNYGGGYFDGFVVKLDEAGAALAYGTYLGGSDWEQVKGLALDAGGDIYLSGNTYSANLPTTPGAVQPHSGGAADAFVAKIALSVQDFSVSGRVTNEYGNGLRGVEVAVSGGVVRVVRTDAEGYYRVSGLLPGAEVTLTASRSGFVFDPQQGVTLTNLSQDETVNFSGAAPLVITGRVAEQNGNGVPVPITLVSDAGSFTDYPSYDGTYTFTVPAGGNYTVTPGPDAEYAFTPSSRSVSDLTADQVWDFAARRTPSIAGRVANEYNQGMANIRVTLTGVAPREPVVQTTDEGGFFNFRNLESGATYTVTPSDPGSNRTFAPPQRSVTVTQTWEYVEFELLAPLDIRGRVADPEGRPLTASVTLSGAANAETQVDEWGYFAFNDLPRGGDYTVTVAKPGSLYTFSPPSRSVNDLQQMQFLEFTALPPLRVMGQVADANYRGLRATVTLSGTANRTTQADEYGFYSFEELPRGGDYTVTPSYPLYTFTPPSRSVSDAQADQVFTFEALPPLRIFGGVTDENWNPVAGATVTLAGAVNRTVITDEYGSYSFEGLPRGGDYTVTAAHELYAFAPASRELPALGADQPVPFYGALRQFTLGGRVADPAGAPLPGVTVALGGSGVGATQTDANGNYAFNDLTVTRGYTVTASRPGYAFAPGAVSIADPRGDQTANFTGSRLTYTVGGRVADAVGGTGLGGVTVSLGGALAATTQTDAQGVYAFAGLPSEGDYTVTASHPNFNFAPASRSFDDLLADAPSADFAGTRINYRIGGSVVDGSGAALPGVTVTLGGARTATAQTDAAGRYAFADLPSGFDYTLTAARTHYTFAPPARQVDDLGGDTTADFNATLLTHNISGRVVDSNGNGFAGAVVSLAGTRAGTVTTDATGNYSFNSLPAGGNYTVEPSRQFYDFGPARGTFDDLGADASAVFTATLRTYNVGGRVTEGANGVAGVTVTLGGSRTAATQTDAAGNYLFTQLPANGTYAVTPSHPIYSFAPGGASFNTLPSDRTANFAATRLLYQVGGYALDACGRALPGVTMSLARDGVTASAQTDAAGFYSFAGVPAGYTYTLAPTGSAYTFSPQAVSFPGLSANQAANFTGRPPASTADVLALADLYVRGGSATSNFGTATQLITRLANQTKDTYETYVKFNVGQPCTVAAVRLRLYGQVSSSGAVPVAVYAVPSTTWTETGTNWNNRPAAGTLLRTVNVAGAAAAWYEWDVTDYVRSELAAGRGVVSFALKSTNATNYQVTFNSREAAGANAPRLAVTTP